MMAKPDFFHFSEDCLLINWEENPSEQLTLRIHDLNDAILKLWPENVVETIPANVSLAVIFDETRISHDELKNSIINLIRNPEMDVARLSKIWEIPVCYSHSESSDIQMVMEKTGLTYPEIISLHSQGNYWVNMIGFLPGFVYLSGLPKLLQLPRKSTPSKLIERGSVAIAGTQSGVYPQDSPGGWFVLGKTPIPMFSAVENPPTFAQVGDRIVFKPISQQEYHLIRDKIQKNGPNWISSDGMFRVEGTDS